MNDQLYITRLFVNVNETFCEKGFVCTSYYSSIRVVEYNPHANQSEEAKESKPFEMFIKASSTKSVATFRQDWFVQW